MTATLEQDGVIVVQVGGFYEPEIPLEEYLAEIGWTAEDFNGWMGSIDIDVDYEALVLSGTATQDEWMMATAINVAILYGINPDRQMSDDDLVYAPCVENIHGPAVPFRELCQATGV